MKVGKVIVTAFCLCLGHLLCSARGPVAVACLGIWPASATNVRESSQIANYLFEREINEFLRAVSLSLTMLVLPPYIIWLYFLLK